MIAWTRIVMAVNMLFGANDAEVVATRRMIEARRKYGKRLAQVTRDKIAVQRALRETEKRVRDDLER